MKAINIELSSLEFMEALHAANNGSKVRRECWPAGQFIQGINHRGLVVIREGQDIAPLWNGPSPSEQDATDWIII
jgi:hypothetical protein